MSELSITPSPNLDNLQRREITRLAMEQVEGLGKFKALLESPHVRRVVLPDGKIAHSVIDVINILSDTTVDPRFQWRDLKERLTDDDKDIGDFISHIPLPLWNDKYGRKRAGDVMTTSGLVILIFELHSKLSNQIRHSIAKMYDLYPSEYHDQILYELEREVGWAGTRIRLEMQSIYEEGDYDNPVEPPGSPK